MASKMLVETSESNPARTRTAYYCVPCGNALENADELEPSTDVGRKKCARCKARIATLPEPPLLAVTVGLSVTMRIGMEASSAPEARVLAFDALHMDGEGLIDWECTSQDSFTL